MNGTRAVRLHVLQQELRAAVRRLEVATRNVRPTAAQSAREDIERTKERIKYVRENFEE